MASPRGIAQLVRLSPRINQNARLLKSPKTPIRKNLGYDTADTGKTLRVPTSSPVNVDTPNRMKMLNHGVSNYCDYILGYGSYGTVIEASYKGRYQPSKSFTTVIRGLALLGDQIAAKIVPHRRNSDHSVNAEKHATSLNHKNIVRVLGVEQGPALSLITMELCGESLQERLDERELTREERIDILKAVAQALQFCHHAGVVHADVKPKNILMAADGQPKLADFGSSVLINESNCRTFTPGTPGYAAPEVLRGEIPSPAADIYSAGILAWQMLSRKAPFADFHPHTILYLTGKGMTPSDKELDDNLRGKYKALYQRMWSFAKGDRPSLDEIITNLGTMICRCL